MSGIWWIIQNPERWWHYMVDAAGGNFLAVITLVPAVIFLLVLSIPVAIMIKRWLLDAIFRSDTGYIGYFISFIFAIVIVIAVITSLEIPDDDATLDPRHT